MIEPCQCVYPDKCFCEVEAKRERLILDAHRLRMQGRYPEAAEAVRQLRELSS